MIVAMIQTVPSRATECGDTIRSVARSGLVGAQLDVFVDQHRRGPHGGFLGMARVLTAEYPTAEWYLTLQDDIRLTEGLDRLIFNDLPTDGVLSLFTPRHAHEQRRSSGWHPILKMRGSYGAQAYLWPGGLLRRYIREAPIEPVDQADHWVLMWCRDNDIPYYHHNPSFCYHAGAGVTTQDLVRGREPCRQCAQWLVDSLGTVAYIR